MVGILSLIFGIAGVLTSFFYIGIFLCIVGITLGIVGLADCFSEKNFPLAGLLVSILGVVLSVYVVVSDVDSGKLIVLYMGNETEDLYADMSHEDMDDISENEYNETNMDEDDEVFVQKEVQESESVERDILQSSYNEPEKADTKEVDVIEDSKKEEQEEIPTEYKSALQKAITYSEIMQMSKASIYEQLISEYGEKFSQDAAQYAMDNIEADWNANALTKAKVYSTEMHMSKAGIYDQLVSEYGERFTAEEAQYAVDHVSADWKFNALKKAEEYQDMMAMSPEAIRDQLVSEYGEKFTEEEADYAISNLN